MSQNFIKNHWLKHGTFLNFLNAKDYYLILFQAPDLEKFRKRWRKKRPYLTNFQAPKFERVISKRGALYTWKVESSSTFWWWEREVEKGCFYINENRNPRLTLLFIFPTGRERGRKRVIKAYIPELWNHRTKIWHGLYI